MKWKKKGLIITASGQREWMQTHIQNPYAIDLNNGRIRVFFTTRGNQIEGLYKANIAWIDLNKNNLSEVMDIAQNPVMDFGKRGTFDEFGMMPGAIIEKDENELWMYYVGWTREQSVPYSWSLGLAISKDRGITFTRYGDGPILGKTFDDPYLQNGCSTVLKENDEYQMFYSSGINWLTNNNAKKPESQYILRRAYSKEGVNWKRAEYPIPLKFDDESQTSPTIFLLNNEYHMLFPYRHSLEFRNAERGYRIGYAYSTDLISWVRNDESVGIDVSIDGWDSEMVCYPHVTEINGKYIMFYCGNGFGQGGLGYAELVCDY